MKFFTETHLEYGPLLFITLFPPIAPFTVHCQAHAHHLSVRHAFNFCMFYQRRISIIYLFFWGQFHFRRLTVSRLSPSLVNARF